jgi:hypothetical protein
MYSNKRGPHLKIAEKNNQHIKKEKRNLLEKSKQRVRETIPIKLQRNGK